VIIETKNSSFNNLRKKISMKSRIFRPCVFLLFSCLYTLSSSFFDFLKSPSATRQVENDAKQKELRQKQILKEKGYQDQVKLFDSISKSRGVPPHLHDQYSGSTFTCDNGSKKISISLVNDAFCDCLDGSDEPGTSACNNGVFYCINSGYKLLSITSSRVDDQICDCCDGSDEGFNRLRIQCIEYFC